MLSVLSAEALRPAYIGRIEKAIQRAAICPKGLLLSGPSLARAILNAKNGRMTLSEAGSAYCFYAAGSFSDLSRPTCLSVIPVFSNRENDTLFVGLKLFAFKKESPAYQAEPADMDDAFALACAMPFASLSVVYCGATQKLVYTESFERWLEAERPSPPPFVEFTDVVCTDPTRLPTDNVLAAYSKLEKLSAIYGDFEPCTLSGTLSQLYTSLRDSRVSTVAKHNDTDVSLGGFVKQLPDLRFLTYTQRTLMLKTVVLQDFLGGGRVSGAGLFGHIKSVGSSKLKFGENKVDWSGSDDFMGILGSCLNLSYFDDARNSPFSLPQHVDFVKSHPYLFAGCSRAAQDRLLQFLSQEKSFMDSAKDDCYSYLNEPVYSKIRRLCEL